MRLTIYRTLLGLAALILLATAGLHATGLPDVSDLVSQAGLSAEWQQIFRGLWLMFSIHLVVVAALLAVLAAGPSGRAPLAVVTVIPIAATILLLVSVGVFVGSIMTGLAALLCLAALVASPARPRR